MATFKTQITKMYMLIRYDDRVVIFLNATHDLAKNKMFLKGERIKQFIV